MPSTDQATIKERVRAVLLTPTGSLRRRGYARSCVTAVRDWLAEQGAAAVALTPSPTSRGLYLDLGFIDDRDPHMLWRPPPPSRL